MPTVWLAVETAEKMAVLNVDYSAQIITVYLHFLSKLFPVEIKNFEETRGLLLETKHKVF